MHGGNPDSKNARADIKAALTEMGRKDPESTGGLSQCHIAEAVYVGTVLADKHKRNL